MVLSSTVRLLCERQEASLRESHYCDKLILNTVKLSVIQTGFRKYTEILQKKVRSVIQTGFRKYTEIL